MKHVKSLTYKPKIDAVLSGDCSQTIRAGRNVSVGDEILFHGWSGKPYRSPWTNRINVKVDIVIPIIISGSGIQFPKSYGDRVIPWTHKWIDGLAALDFIDPPTGEALRDVLFKLNGIPKEPVPAQIIRWGD